ncbi:MAG: TlpA family protein disulfide reductase [Myxococcales bacterium]|nr:TlpA family protein disulfide reductase [Myxococcales bacterium]
MTESSKSSSPAKEPEEKPSSSTALRAAQAFFALSALGVVVTFGGAVRDGETRRSPDTLVRMLQPDYEGRNRTAPDFTLRDKDGRPVRLSDFRGKTVVLHFWSRTCAPCIDELQRSLPAFDELVHGRSDVALVLVTTDPDWNSVQELVPDGFKSPILFDPSSSVVGGRYGTRLFPETWVIDPRGVIRARFDRTLEWDSSVFFDFLLSLR